MGFLSWKNKSEAAKERRERTIPVDAESVEEVERVLRPINAAPEPSPAAQEPNEETEAKPPISATPATEDAPVSAPSAAEPAARPEPKPDGSGREAEQPSAVISEPAATPAAEDPPVGAPSAAEDPPVSAPSAAQPAVTPATEDAPVSAPSAAEPAARPEPKPDGSGREAEQPSAVIPEPSAVNPEPSAIKSQPAATPAAEDAPVSAPSAAQPAVTPATEDAPVSASSAAEPAARPEPSPDGSGREAEQPSAVIPEQPSAIIQPRLKPQDLIAPTRHDVPGFPKAGGPSPSSEPAKPQTPVSEAMVISFANQKGGVAKTTTTLNLAVAFAEAGHSVLCVDLDPQGNLTMSQGIDPDRVETSMYDVLVHDVPIIDVIAEREIDIAVASIDLAGAEIAMSTKIGRERSLEKALKEVKPFYDFICIDTPPSLGLLTINALTASDKVIVPVQCEYLSMRGLVQLQNTLRMIQENLNPNVQIEGILPTMLDTRTVHAKEAIEILEENYGDLVFKSRIRKAIKFAEAPVRGSSVLKYDPQGNAANCYRELAKEVLTHGKA